MKEFVCKANLCAAHKVEAVKHTTNGTSSLCVRVILRYANDLMRKRQRDKTVETFRYMQPDDVSAEAYAHQWNHKMIKLHDGRSSSRTIHTNRMMSLCRHSTHSSPHQDVCIVYTAVREIEIINAFNRNRKYCNDKRAHVICYSFFSWMSWTWQHDENSAICWIENKNALRTSGQTCM